MSFRFGEISPRFGASKNIVRKFESIFESSKFLHDKVFFKDTLQIHKYWYCFTLVERLRFGQRGPPLVGRSTSVEGKGKE